MYTSAHSRVRGPARRPSIGAIPESFLQNRNLPEDLEASDSVGQVITHPQILSSSPSSEIDSHSDTSISTIAAYENGNLEVSSIAGSPIQSFPQLLSQSDLECPLCYRLLFQPVTTKCGHSYCKSCLTLAVAYNPVCPICRTRIHESPNVSPDFSVSFVLAHLIEKNFPQQYQTRFDEDKIDDELRKTAAGDTKLEQLANPNHSQVAVQQLPDADRQNFLCYLGSIDMFGDCSGPYCYLSD